MQFYDMNKKNSFSSFFYTFHEIFEFSHPLESTCTGHAIRERRAIVS